MLQSLGLQGIRHGLATKSGREEPAHIRGQGQKPGGPHAQRAVAKRGYPTSKVRGSGREYQTATAQEQPRGATPHPRSGGVMRGVTPRPGRGGGREELPHSPKPEARDCGWEDQSHVQGAIAAPAQEGLEELSHLEGQERRW